MAREEASIVRSRCKNGLEACGQITYRIVPTEDGISMILGAGFCEACTEDMRENLALMLALGPACSRAAVGG